MKKLEIEIERAPEFKLPESALSQPVAWTEGRGFISLREFIAFNAIW